MVCFPSHGGSGVVATELGKQLARRNHQVHFISSSMPFRLSSYEANTYYHEVTSLDYPLFQHQFYALSLASTIIDVVRKHGLELLHVHYATPHAAAGFLAREILEKNYQIDLPLVTTLHGTDITLVGRNKTYLPLVQFCINASDAITAVSEYLCRETTAHFKPKKSIEVINNFVDLSHPKAPSSSVRKRFALPKEHVVVHVSNMRPVKRILDVVETFSLIIQQQPATLVMVGDGPDRLAAEALVAHKGLKEKVHFLGNVGAVEDILAVADLFLLPSEQESFGLAALEAMSLATPVVATDVGNLPQLLGPQEAGYVCSVGAVDDMAARACQVLDESQLSAFKARALARATKLDASCIVPLYESLYERVLGKARRKG